MRLLLDTHIWLWSIGERSRVAPAVRDALEDPDNELWLSPVSVWETLLAAEKGRVQLSPDPLQWLDSASRVFPVRDALLNREVAVTSRSLDLPHQDPADRFIAATAVVYELALVTADRRLLGSMRYDTLANR